MEVAGLFLAMLGTLFGVVVILGGPCLYLYLQIRALWTWRGWWRLAAILPLAVMAPATARMVQAFRDGATLAPFVVILLAPLAAGWLAAFAAMRSRRLS